MEHKLSLMWQGHTFAANFAELPEASQRYLIEYGFKQVLNDARAMTKEEKAEIGGEAAVAEHMRERMRAKFDRLIAGTITERANAARGPVDPAERHKQDVLMEMLRAIAKSQNIKLPSRTGKNADPERLDLALSRLYAKRQAEVDAIVASRLADDAKLSKRLGDVTDVLSALD